MNWADTSEIVLGLILDKRLTANAVHPDMFVPPYDKAIKLIKDKPGISIEDLIMQTGLSPIQDAFEQVHRLNGLGDRDWIKILEQSRSLYDAGIKMQKWSKHLTDGDDIKWEELRGLLNTIEVGQSADFRGLSDITDEEMPFIETGWEAFDAHVGGLPEVGMTILGGLPGAGKTTAIIRFAGSFVQKHKDKKVAFFSLEMIAQEVGPRIRSLMHLTKEEQSRIMVCDKPLTIQEIISKSASIDDLGLIIIDFIDLAISGIIEVGNTSAAYVDLSRAAKLFHVPIIVVAQLTGITGIPKPQNIRWSRLAWGLAWEILMVYDQSRTWTDNESDQKELPNIEGEAYIIVWKIRGGFRKHLADSPGAIRMPFNGKMGWCPHANRSHWHNLQKYGV